MKDSTDYMPKFNAICDVSNHPTEEFLRGDGGIILLASPDTTSDTVNPRTIALHDLLKSTDIRLLKRPKIYLMIEQHANFHEGVFSDFLDDAKFLAFLDENAKKQNRLIAISEYDNETDSVEADAYEKNRAFMQRNDIQNIMECGDAGLVCIENLQIESIPDILLLSKEKKIPVIATIKCPEPERQGADGEMMASFFGWLFSPENLGRATASNGTHILEMMETNKWQKLISIGVKPETIAGNLLDALYSVAVIQSSPIKLNDMFNPAPDFYASEILDFFTSELNSGKHVEVPQMRDVMKDRLHECDVVVKEEMENQAYVGHDFHALPLSESLDIMRGCAKERDLELTLQMKKSARVH